tara:strand:- start:853 stop:2307 length:1455 start_codon:yes stop_codon:yes gene_type:complete
MRFIEFEKTMNKRGVFSLAEIARLLNTTPQAVSNWKSRDQVPNHVALKIVEENKLNSTSFDSPISSQTLSPNQITNSNEQPTVSDILVTFAEQLKLFFLVPFFAVFLTFTYVKFIKKPLYESWATILLPENQMNSLGGFAGIASQFGVNIPSETSADLSSPNLFPQILKSRRFAEKILDKEFYIKEHDSKLTLLSIISNKEEITDLNRNILIEQAVSRLNNDYLTITNDIKTNFSTIKITTFDPIFAKDLAVVVINELELLNRLFKKQSVIEKTKFIEERISSVESDLENSEEVLKQFYEKNRQISSPSLELEEDKLKREVEVQKSLFLTLKQQLEVSKIEEVQKSTVLQILDYPKVPYRASNINLLTSVILSTIFGFGLAIFLSIVRSVINTSNLEERKKLRRLKHYAKKKSAELLFDVRVNGSISLTMIMMSPLYFGAKSSNPIYFGRYSAMHLFINIIYLVVLFISASFFIKSFTKQKETK